MAMEIENFVSSNHCQDGSNFEVYKLVNDYSENENMDLKPLFNSLNRESTPNLDRKPNAGFHKSIKKNKLKRSKLKLPKRTSKPARKLTKIRK